MLQNYFKLAWRFLLKRKLFSFINIGGLAIGMVAALLIGLWVWDELSYNRSYENYEHIAVVYRRFTQPSDGEVVSSDWLQQPVVGVLKKDYGRLFKHVVMLRPGMDYSLKIGESELTGKGQFIENGVIDMFSLHMLRGNKESLNDNQAIILSESAAKALFGNQDPMNQVVNVDHRFTGRVTGVYADVKPNSIFGDVQFFGNYENLKMNNQSLKANENNWGNTSHKIFVQLADGVSMEQANAVIDQLYEKQAPPDYAQGAKKYKTSVWLHPMKDWYLYSEFKNGYPVSGRVTYVWLFSIIGTFILLLACINFINLSTARSEKRAREVGIRKAIGSLRAQLIIQFLSESFLVVLFALMISVAVVKFVLPAFNQLAFKRISLPLTNPYFMLILLGFLLITSLLAGLYPAFYLSSFKPVKVISGKIITGKYASLPRKILVVVQFAASVIMIVGTFIVYQQIRYAQNRPAGYHRDGLLRIALKDPAFANNRAIFQNALKSSGVVREVSLSSSPVTAIWDNWGSFTWKGKQPDAESNFTVTWVDENYGKTIQWKLLEGRDFSRDYGMDTTAVIINESAAKYLGFKNPVGEFISQESEKTPRQIIGVVNDVIAQSPYEPVKPGFYWLDRTQDNLWTMQVSIRPGVPSCNRCEKLQSHPENNRPIGQLSTTGLRTTNTMKNSPQNNASGNYPPCLLFLPFLFPVWDYLAWPVLLPNKEPKNWALEKCWVQLWAIYGRCFRKTLYT